MWSYPDRRSPNPEPVDILFLNLSNWPFQPVYPYAFVQVSALARRAGLSVVRWDGVGLSRQQQLERISQLVSKHQPRTVAFTIRQADSMQGEQYFDPACKLEPPWFPVEDTHSAIAHIRQLSDAKIVVGGFFFTANALAAAQYLQPDYGVIGEPDEFLAHLEQVLARQPQGIANLLYRADGQWRENPRVLWGPFDDIEYTDAVIDEIFRFHGERELRNTHRAVIPEHGATWNSAHCIAIEIARGCPNSCAYCIEPKVKGQTLRRRDLDVIEAEIHNLLRHELRYYWFVCSELDLTKDHVFELAERVIRINETIPRPIFWRANFLPGGFNKDELRLLYRSGLMWEQHGPFSDLRDENLRQMREPYRARRAVRHVKDMLELNEEPEFQARRQSRWFLWSWLWNPYATLDSVRETLTTFNAEKFDLQYDEAFSFPALRVYECLDSFPAHVKAEAIIVTRDEATSKTLIHPAFYYNRRLVEHFGGLAGVHEFINYVNETFLSRHYRATRNWSAFACSLGLPQLEEILESLKDADLEEIQMPPWVDHPDLGEANPIRWRKQAIVWWQQNSLATELVIKTGQLTRETHSQQDAGVAILAFLLHVAFSANRQEMGVVFKKLGLPLDAEGYPPASPYLTLSTLIRSHTTEAGALEAVKQGFAPKLLALFRYYLYALNIRLDPKYTFLSSS